MSLTKELILTPDNSRYVMFPVSDNTIWAMYKKQIDCFWRAEEVDLANDLKDWNTLNNDEQYFIKMILAFFAASDGLVLENLAARFMCEVQLSEARAFYGFQIAMENIHSEMYSLLIETYVKDSGERDQLFNSMDRFECIKKKADWSKQWINNENASFATRLVAFACVEGIFFSGAFCAIYWLKKRSLMPGLTFSNELISRDEALHTEFAIYLYTTLKDRLSREAIYIIIRDAVSIETEFIASALPCKLIGMNNQLMTQYIEFIADRLCVQFGYDKIYNSANPFDWMEMISIEGKTNFFEKRVGEYALAKKEQCNRDEQFSFDNDF